MFLDVENTVFKKSVQGSYVDKSEIISDLNSLLDDPKRFVLISRSRRFGKTYTIRMLNDRVFMAGVCGGELTRGNFEYAEPDRHEHL